jgi:hypothetical protein
MGPLAFVNWSAVNAGFRRLMWVIALVLAVVIIMNAVPSSPSVHQAQHVQMR